MRRATSHWFVLLVLSSVSFKLVEFCFWLRCSALANMPSVLTPVPLSPSVSPTGFQQKQPDPGGTKQVLQPPAGREDLHQRILHWPQHLRWLLALTAGQRGHHPRLRCALYPDSWHHAWDGPTRTLYGSWNISGDSFTTRLSTEGNNGVLSGALGVHLENFSATHPETRDWNLFPTWTQRG